VCPCPDPSIKRRRNDTWTFHTFTSQVKAMPDRFAAEGVAEVVTKATESSWNHRVVCSNSSKRAGSNLKLVKARNVKILPAFKPDILAAE
jgi:hypothetical protein